MITFSPTFGLSWSAVQLQNFQHNHAAPFNFGVRPCLLNRRS